MCIKRTYSVNTETSKVMKKTIKRSNSCPNISGFTDKTSNTTDTEKIVEIKNLCVVCGVDIGDDGLVNATYSNGTTKSLSKIVLANFAAPTGLRQLGDASYYATSKSGNARYGEAGSAGYGTVRAGARERANVDLTNELVELITSQRAFQANAKAIETSNTLTQAIINIRS